VRACEREGERKREERGGRREKERIEDMKCLLI
jgi:hypothetical protein